MRLGFLGTALAVLLGGVSPGATAPLSAQTWRPWHGPPRVDEQASDADLVAEIPLLLDGNWLVVPVEVRGDTLRFLLDTGANRGAVSRRVADRLRLRRTATALVTGASGLARVPVVEAGWIRLEDARMGDPQKFVLEDGILTDSEGRTFDGIIGADLLPQYDVLIDVPSETLRLYKAGSTAGIAGPVVGPELALPLERIRRGLIGLEVGVNGRPVGAILDTGSPVLLLNKLAASRAGAAATSAPVSETVRGVGSAKILTFGTTIGSIQLGASELTDFVAEIADLPVFGRLGFGNEPAMLLGTPVVLACPLLISYRDRTLRFCPTGRKE
jgi:predicted aspartyl protease